MNTSVVSTSSSGVSRGNFWRYVGVGLFNSGFDFGLFSLLSLVVGLHPVAANAVSTSVTMCVSFLLNGVFVFRASGRMSLKSFLCFVAITLSSGVLVQGAVIYAIVHTVPLFIPALPGEWVKMGAKICSMGCGMVWNYIGYRWLFKGGSSSEVVNRTVPDHQAPDSDDGDS